MAAEKLHLRDDVKTDCDLHRQSVSSTDEKALKSVDEGFVARSEDSRASAVHALIEEAESRLLQPETILQPVPVKKWPLRWTASFVIASSLLLWAGILIMLSQVFSLL